MIKKIKKSVPWIYAIEDFDGEEEIAGTFHRKELQKKKKKKIKQRKIEKVIKKIAGKLFVKWKDYDICLIDFYI